MNFKTTIVLLVLLVVAGGYLLWSGGGGEPQQAPTPETRNRLIAFEPGDVTKVVVAPADGQRFVLQKAGNAWTLAEPVTAAAERLAADDLVRGLTELRSRGQLDPQGKDAVATGLDHPRYRVELTAKDGKTAKLAIGSKAAVGDGLYVLLDGNKKADIVPAEISDKLDQPASSYRDARLVDTPVGDIRQLTITRADGKLVLQKTGNDWRMVEPQQLAVEPTEATDLLAAVTGLRATEFVSEDAKEAKTYGLADPKVSVWLSSTPATQPATQPTGITLKFGRYDDVMKKNVYAMASSSSSIVKVPATVLTSLDKRPLDLRDRKVLQVEADQVSRISLTTDVPATTQPTTRPASHKQFVLERRKESLTLGPATQPTTQAAATQPASKWVLGGSAANDAAIDALLHDLQPLRAARYLEKSPTTQPATRYVLQVHSEGPGGTPVNDYQIELVDPGNSEPVIGSAKGLIFELDRAIIEHLQADFAHPSAPVAQD